LYRRASTGAGVHVGISVVTISAVWGVVVVIPIVVAVAGLFVTIVVETIAAILIQARLPAGRPIVTIFEFVGPVAIGVVFSSGSADGIARMGIQVAAGPQIGIRSGILFVPGIALGCTEGIGIVAAGAGDFWHAIAATGAGPIHADFIVATIGALIALLTILAGDTTALPA
jgi:hypothetical protein